MAVPGTIDLKSLVGGLADRGRAARTDSDVQSGIEVLLLAAPFNLAEGGAFKMSGGNIRNICLTAAYLAADVGRPVAMADLSRGTEREYRKLGHLCGEGEFGPYYELVASVAK